MSLHNRDQSKELLNSQAHIWNHIFSFINSMTLKCAIELNIPDIINSHGAPMLLSELVEAMPINKERAHFVYRLMRILVHSGFFVTQSVSRSDDEEEGEGYLLAHASRLLLKEEPLTLRPLLLAMLDPILLNPWQQLSEWFQNGDVNPFYTTHGTTFWELAGQNPKLNNLFNEAMATDAGFVESVVINQSGSVFEGLTTIVDVGGGTGTVVKAIARAFPKLSCICFDLPHVVNGLVESTNLYFMSGDMFEAIPKADAVLLKWILHDWSDEDCIKILKRSKEAISSKENAGKVIIIDIVVKTDNEDEGSLKAQLLWDMLMMVDVMGRERTEKDWANLFSAAGFSDYKISPILGLRSIIEVYP